MHMIQKESMTLMVSSSERFGKQIVQIIQIISQNEALAYLVVDFIDIRLTKNWVKMVPNQVFKGVRL